MDGRAEKGAARRRAVGTEVKDKLNASGSACPAASNSGSASPAPWRCGPRLLLFDAMLGARSDLDRQDRGIDPELARITLSPSSPTNMQQAARVSDKTA